MSRIKISLVIVSGILAVFFSSTAFAQNPSLELSKTAAAQFNQNNYAAAAQSYEQLLKDYPTSDVALTVPLQLGYCYYFLSQFDKSKESLEKFLKSAGATPALKADAQGLLPQVISAQATALPASDPHRKALYEDAIKKYTEFITQYPNVPEVEGATRGRAIANFQIGNYDEAAKDLESNIQKFAKSPSIMDSQSLLALTYATQGSKLLIAGGDNAKGLALYDKAAQILRDIISKKSDLTLVNAANFQLGEILFSRAGYAPDNEKKDLFQQARDVYTSVLSKNDLIAIQQEKIDGFPARVADAVKRGDVKGVQALNAEKTRQTEKLLQLKGGNDQVLSSLLKVGEIYLNEGNYDEARVIFSHLMPLLQNEDEKKSALYFITLTYAAQGNIEKAIASYNQFQSQYKGDAIAWNLPLVIGNMLLVSSDPKAPDAVQQSEQYFKDSMEIYPKGQGYTSSAIGLATAQAKLGHPDEALKSYQDLLKTNIKPADAVLAQLGIANIYKDTQKWDDAIANYKIVVEKYPDAKPQVTDAEFWIAESILHKGDAAGAIPLLKAFIAKYPDTAYIPDAMFELGRSQLSTGDIEGGIATMKTLADKYPKSHPASFTYFARAQFQQKAQKPDEVKALMEEFIQKYPDDDKVFAAYETLAQLALAKQGDEGKSEVLKLYRDYASKYPTNPHAIDALIKAANLQYARAEGLGRYSALNEAERATWKTYIDSSVAMGEQIVTTYPDNPDLAQALQSMLLTQRALMNAGIKKPADVEKYFQDMADNTKSPIAKSKILFTLAPFIAETDAPRALEIIQKAYDPSILYAPQDMDYLGTALIEQKKLDEAQKVFEKLATDYPLPPGVAPNQGTLQVQQAQSIALFGKGRIAQLQGKSDESGKLLEQLRTEYGWSPKILEATYLIAENKRKTDGDEAMKSLIPVIRSQTASPEIHAKALLLCGYISKDKMEAATDEKVKKDQRDYAIDYFLKIAQLYGGVSSVAPIGLWEGAQLLEQQIPTLTDPKAKERQTGIAKGAYQDLVDKYPNSPYADKAKERLAALGGTK